jgi:hypothetical protein
VKSDEFYKRMAPSKWLTVFFPTDNSITTLKRVDLIQLAVYDDDGGGLRVKNGGKLWEGSIVAEAGKLFRIRALSAHLAAEFNILPGSWQHVWLVAIVPPKRWRKMD